MVTDELATMREVVSGLRGDPGKGGALLSSAVRRHAARCGQLFGIQVEVEIEQDMPVSRRLAGELFHMVAEGLSNIGRHTQSRWAWVSLNMQGNQLILKIRNKTDDGTNTSQTFTPRSLTERAADLGGSVEIQRGELQTTVTISVPISTDTSANERLSPNEQAA
jgi:signal transduction histidine kinase